MIPSPRLKSTSETSLYAQSPLIKGKGYKRSDRSSMSTCSSNTMQILPEEVNWTSTISNNNSITSAVLSSQPSCESFRNVEYEIAAIPQSSMQKLHSSDIASKLLIENLYMNVQACNNNKNINNYDQIMLSDSLSTHSNYLLTYQKNDFKLEEQLQTTITEASQGIFNRLKGLKCISIQNYKQSNILQINFIQNPQCEGSQPNSEFRVQEQSFAPQINSAHNIKLNHNLQEFNNTTTNSDSQLNPFPFSLPNYQDYNREKLRINLHSIDSTQFSTNIQPISKILSNQNAKEELCVFSCDSDSVDCLVDEEADSNSSITFKTITNAENWIKLRMKSSPSSQKFHDKVLQNSGSNYFIFAFDEKMQKYSLCRQFVDSEFLELIRSNQEEVTYSYLHSEELYQETPHKIQSYMQRTTESALPSFNKEIEGFQNQNINQNGDYSHIVQTINCKEYSPVTSTDRLIFLHENMHMMNPSYIATTYQQQSSEIQSQQVLPLFIVLEQSYFISSDKKQGNDSAKPKKNSIIKMYQNTIKKNVAYRSFINHQYLTQSLAFQEKFYHIKTEWKRRGKNQKRRSINNDCDESYSMMTN